MARRTAQSPKDSQSSTLVVVSPTVKRLRAVLKELSDFVTREGDSRQKRMQRVLRIVVDEAVDELGEVDERFMRSWMYNMACVIEWTATGDMSVLPAELISFACKVEGINPHDFFRVDETEYADPGDVITVPAIETGETT